ncbi:DNA-binding transcriptional regulator, LysR family [Rhizobium sp. NFR03]|nr:DNA-binding transcriptional regulator, LysR family [Rhizobium sp. NFR03]
MQSDLNALAAFALVAEKKSFRAAADAMGVTRSAVSQTIRRLEETLGIALVHRTTRSVSLTEAGERLYVEVAPALRDMRGAIEAVANFRGRPRGQLTLAVSSIAESFLSGPLLAAFLEENPEVTLHITVTDEEFDIVAEGYDAGVRLGEVIAQDMIAVPVSGEQRQLAVASPGYLERFGTPNHPSELASRRCIGWRRATNVAPYRWEFEEEGRAFSCGCNGYGHDDRHGVDDQARQRRRRDQLRHGGQFPAGGGERETGAGSPGVLPALPRLLSLLSQPPQHGAETQGAGGASKKGAPEWPVG